MERGVLYFRAPPEAGQPAFETAVDCSYREDGDMLVIEKVHEVIEISVVDPGSPVGSCPCG